LCRGAALTRGSLRAATESGVVKNKSKRAPARPLEAEPAVSDDKVDLPEWLIESMRKRAYMLYPTGWKGKLYPETLQFAAAELGHNYGRWLRIRDGLPVYWNEPKPDSKQVAAKIQEMKEFLALICDWPLSRIANFLTPFSRALDYQRDLGHRPPNQLSYCIYDLILKHPGDILKCRSISQASDFMLERLPEHLRRLMTTGDERSRFKGRVAKICQRIKLRLRPRGRPRKK